MAVICPGRMTSCHSQFLSEFGNLSGHNILVIDTAAAQLAYESNASHIMLCTNEKYLLELHKFLSLTMSIQTIKETWESSFENGTNISFVTNRLKWLNYKSDRRNISSWSWKDMSIYYCLLAQGGFSYSFDKWALRINKNNPTSPPYDDILHFQSLIRGKTILYRPRRSIYNFPTRPLTPNTILYLHMPIRFSQYGCAYVWTKRKFEFAREQLVELAQMGHKVCVSCTYTRWGRDIPSAKDLFPSPLFTPRVYTELKAPSSYGLNNLTREIYYVSGF